MRYHHSFNQILLHSTKDTRKLRRRKNRKTQFSYFITLPKPWIEEILRWKAEDELFLELKDDAIVIRKLENVVKKLEEYCGECDHYEED